MEIMKAKIVRKESNACLRLIVNENEMDIDLGSEDAKAIKAVFNRLINELKNKAFKFELNDSGNDLYNAICKEYLRQLNNEMRAIRRELEVNDLINEQ